MRLKTIAQLLLNAVLYHINGNIKHITQNSLVIWKLLLGICTHLEHGMIYNKGKCHILGLYKVEKYNESLTFLFI